MNDALKAFAVYSALVLVGCAATTRPTPQSQTNTQPSPPNEATQVSVQPTTVRPASVKPPHCDNACQRQKCMFPVLPDEQQNTQAVLTKADFEKRLTDHFKAYDIPESKKATRGIEKGISGIDEREDYYQMSTGNKALADSTVLVTWRERILFQKDTSRWYVETGPLMQFGMKACDGERFAQQRTGGFCSGFLIAKDTIVTAGHCVHETPVEELAFVFGYRMNSSEQTHHYTRQSQVFTGKSIIAARLSRKPEDFALIRLDRAVPPEVAKPLPINFSAVKKGDVVGVIGYPSGLPVKAAFGNETKVSRGHRTIYFTNLDTFGGNSGSPVFNPRGEVVGILVQGATDYRRIRSKKCFKVMRYHQRASREVVARISQFERFIPHCLKQ